MMRLLRIAVFVIVVLLFNEGLARWVMNEPTTQNPHPGYWFSVANGVILGVLVLVYTWMQIRPRRKQKVHHARIGLLRGIRKDVVLGALMATMIVLFAYVARTTFLSHNLKLGLVMDIANIDQEDTSPRRNPPLPPVQTARFYGWIPDQYVFGEDLTMHWTESTHLYRLDLENADFRDVHLAGAFLWFANLTGADLEDTHLAGAGLNWAQLQDANLQGANLQGAKMSCTSLQDTDLRGGDLRGASLPSARLAGADLRGANLQGADLSDANFAGANLGAAQLEGAALVGLSGCSLLGIPDAYAEFDENTILPDGTKYNPDLGIEQMERFGAIVRPEDVPEN